MTRRTGTSLIEVLVTIGILGIGLISVIALFPMAAITMGQALRDDRTASSAVTADGYIRNVHYRNVVEQSTNPIEPYYNAMDYNPASGTSPIGGTFPQFPMSTSDTNPSYPVFVDPMGYVASNGATVGDFGSFTNGGGTTTYPIPRVTLSVMNATPTPPNSLALRLCSQMDGLTYNDYGTALSNGGAITRELRYNWLWVLQRPTNSDRLTTTCKVVVFDRRVYLYKPPGSETIYPNVAFNLGQTSVVIPNTADVRKGSWVMDCTIGTDSHGSPIRQAHFYRVLSVSDDGVHYTLELNTPITRLDVSTNSYTGNLLVMPAVVDVFERPVLTSNPLP